LVGLGLLVGHGNKIFGFLCAAPSIGRWFLSFFFLFFSLFACNFGGGTVGHEWEVGGRGNGGVILCFFFFFFLPVVS